MMYGVLVPLVVVVVTMLLVMQPVVLQMAKGAAGDAVVSGSGDRDMDTSGLLLGLLGDPGKRNSIQAAQRLMALLVLRMVRVMHRLMVLLVMPMVTVREGMHREMVPLVTPMVRAGVATGGGAAGDAGDDGAVGDVTGDEDAGNGDGEGVVGDAKRFEV